MGAWFLGAALTALSLIATFYLPAAELDLVLRRSWPGYTRESFSGVAAQGAYAYVLAGINAADTLHIVDIRDPANPCRVGTYSPGNTIRSAAVSGSYACLAVNEGLDLVDFGDPTQPKRVGGFALDPDLPGAQAVQGHHVYLAGKECLEVFDLSDRAGPTRAGACCNLTTSRDSYGAMFTVSGNLACAAFGRAELQVINISDPINPPRVGGY